MTDARRALLGGLIDDAAQFPPARLPLAEALAGYRANAAGPHAWLQGRFLCPAARLDELAAIALDREPMEVGAVVAPDARDGIPAALEAAARLPDHVRMTAVEARLPADPARWEVVLRALDDPGPVRGAYLEAPVRALGPTDAVTRLADVRTPGGRVQLAAKLRCGGPTADAVPPVDLVADFLAAAIAEQLPFKATAGLHHPVRHFNHADGWVHHGFLNVQGGAVLLAARAIDEADLPALIAENDPSAFTLTPAGFAWRGHAVDAPAITQARALVHGHGSCSFTEPVEDLTALGILAEGANGQV